MSAMVCKIAWSVIVIMCLFGLAVSSDVSIDITTTTLSPEVKEQVRKNVNLNQRELQYLFSDKRSPRNDRFNLTGYPKSSPLFDTVITHSPPGLATKLIRQIPKLFKSITKENETIWLDMEGGRVVGSTQVPGPVEEHPRIKARKGANSSEAYGITNETISENVSSPPTDTVTNGDNSMLDIPGLQNRTSVFARKGVGFPPEMRNESSFLPTDNTAVKLNKTISANGSDSSFVINSSVEIAVDNKTKDVNSSKIGISVDSTTMKEILNSSDSSSQPITSSPLPIISSPLPNVSSSHPNITFSDKNMTAVTPVPVTVEKNHNRPKPTKTVLDGSAFPESTTSEADYVVPIVGIVFSIPLIAVLIMLFYKKGAEFWERRHYKRMDFLIDGMYND